LQRFFIRTRHDVLLQRDSPDTVKVVSSVEFGRLIRVSVFLLVLVVANPPQVAHLNTDSRTEAFAAVLSTRNEGSVRRVSAVELDASTRRALPKYGNTLRQTGIAFQIDWRLLLAIMKEESRYVETAESHRGASGLMQIMPATGAELATRLGMEDLDHPDRNIQGGALYLAQLYNLFETAEDEQRLRLAVAAYNAGPARIYDAQEIAAFMGENPYSWTSIKSVLPLLSKRYYTLHQLVWDGGKPRNGYFGKSRQTIDYVEKVVDSYRNFLAVLH